MLPEVPCSCDTILLEGFPSFQKTVYADSRLVHKSKLVSKMNVRFTESKSNDKNYTNPNSWMSQNHRGPIYAESSFCSPCNHLNARHKLAAWTALWWRTSRCKNICRCKSVVVPKEMLSWRQQDTLWPSRGVFCWLNQF